MKKWVNGHAAAKSNLGPCPVEMRAVFTEKEGWGITVFRIPKSRIVLFVLLSMMTAFAYHYWYLPRFSEQKDLASTAAVIGLSNQVLNIVGTAPSTADKSSAAEAVTCQCTVAGVENPLLQFEDPEKCGPERNYLEAGLAKLDPIFREDRAKSSADFPRSCLTYIMRSTYADAESVSSQFFTTCKDNKSTPERGARKACITKTYVNAVYNTFGDLTDCMSVPARDYLPKLAMESGFHTNIRGGRLVPVLNEDGTVKKYADGTEVKEMSGGDTGIPQFIDQSIEHANTQFKKMQNMVKNSDKDSCKRISKSVQDLSPIGSGIGERCGLVVPPQNPLQSLFYMMIKYHQDSSALDYFLSKPGNDIFMRLKNLGLDETKYDREQLKQMLLILSYNSGPNAAVIQLANYLKAVEATGRKLTLADFNIGKESTIYRKINDKTMRLRRMKTDSEEIWKKRKADFEIMTAELSKMDLSFTPKVVPVSTTDEAGTYDTYKVEFEPGQLSYAAYTMLYTTSGNGGYLSKVRASANKINSVFKEGVCVPDSYLSL